MLLSLRSPFDARENPLFGIRNVEWIESDAKTLDVLKFLFHYLVFVSDLIWYTIPEFIFCKIRIVPAKSLILGILELQYQVHLCGFQINIFDSKSLTERGKFF